MKKFKIYAGLGGGFGGAEFIKEGEYENAYLANEDAYYEAREIYESYGGLHGLLNEEMWLEDNDSMEGYEEAYEEDIDSWIEYYVEEA